MALVINAQLASFVEFARLQTNDKAIARVGVAAAGDGPLAGRAITAATNDKVAPIGPRSGDDKRANNAARELFREAVFAMFGGRENLPSKVAAAMKFGDYGTDARPLGKPLTARRILKVSRAIMEAMEPAVGTVSLKQARGLVDNAVSWMNDLSPKMSGMNRFNPLRLDDVGRDKAARLVVKYGAGLTAANLGVLAGYAAVAIDAARLHYYDDEGVDEIVRRIAQTLKNVRNFKPGDPRLSEFDAKMTKYWQAVLREQLGPTQMPNYNADGMFNAFRGDAGRNEYKIGDEVFPSGPEKRDRLTQTFKDRIPNLLHRKALSAFLTQMTGGAAACLSVRDPLPATPGFKSLKMTSTKGHDLFLTVDKKDAFFQNRSLQGNADSTYELKLSDDGTKATITVRSPAKLRFIIDGAMEYSTVPTGICEQQVEFDFNLADPNSVTLTAVRHGQTIVPPSPPQAAPDEEGMPRIDA
jgi:hypothetical protein